MGGGGWGRAGALWCTFCLLRACPTWSSHHRVSRFCVFSADCMGALTRGGDGRRFVVKAACSALYSNTPLRFGRKVGNNQEGQGRRRRRRERGNGEPSWALLLMPSLPCYLPTTRRVPCRGQRLFPAPPPPSPSFTTMKHVRQGGPAVPPPSSLQLQAAGVQSRGCVSWSLWQLASFSLHANPTWLRRKP